MTFWEAGFWMLMVVLVVAIYGVALVLYLGWKDSRR
jgi:hypothetical protein